ncbi:MAG: hypothetical protein P8X79_22860, partial [Reinekea sp.]
FIIRQHQQIPFEILSEFEPVGQSESGDIYEQWTLMQDEDGKAVRLRRISVKLKQKTRSEDSEMNLWVYLQFLKNK